MEKIVLSYEHDGDTILDVSNDNLLVHVQPKRTFPLASLEETVQKGLECPIGSEPLKVLAEGCKDVLIVSDDYTRLTPTHRIIPIIIDTLNAIGIKDEQITIMVAQGTHRPMLPEELKQKFGEKVLTRVRVMPHEFDNPQQLISLGRTVNGTDIWINRRLAEADFVLGVGNILPHGYAGFSGGAKIIQPGVSGTITTGQTHWLSVKHGQFLGNSDNPIRKEMELVADQAGLRFIVNTIMNLQGEVVGVVCGDHRAAFQEGAKIAHDIFSVAFPQKADIVITDAFPHVYNLWQGGKALYSARMAVKKGGTIVLAAPCVEGIGDEERFYELLQLHRREIIDLVESGVEKDLFIATPAANVREVCEECDVILVSRGISKHETEAMNFRYANSIQEAVEMAYERQGKTASVITMAGGADLIPHLS
jgi:nickel-dependent lactate racemase